MTREEVYRVIDGERKYQDWKWGSIEDRPHEVGAWIALMENLLEDARRAWGCSRSDMPALDELRKLVAVGVACMEQHGVPGRVAVLGDNNPKVDPPQKHPHYDCKASGD